MGGGGIIAVPFVILAVAAAIGIGIFAIIVLGRVIWRVISHIFRVVGAWIADCFRLVGALIVSVVFIPLILLNVVIGRWSASAHFGRAFTGECKTIGGCLYRIAIGHPLRLIGLGGVTEGLEHRLPQAVADAPGRDKPSKRQGLFEGYTIVGSLPGGGSGGKLYIAEPDALKRAAFDRQGHTGVERVVIKTFSLTDGSSLPQIVRESRALDAAKKMGLVLEHELNEQRFYYVMRYVPGDSLTIVTQRLHADGDGLDPRGMKLAIGYASDLLESLDLYHRGGLWHKDVKPDNLIVDRTPDPALGRGKAHLVDFGLITPLRSAMTLTTHGTEYFRDPELVRQALRGVKVHQIDGAKFDVYAAGAVLYSVIENSFPAHGGLSQVSKRCPEAIRWIIRRAMTDYDKRYATAHAMLDDLRVVAAAEDPFSVKPADLPSMRGGTAMPEAVSMPEPASFNAPQAAAPASPEPVSVAAAASPIPPRNPPRQPQAPFGEQAPRHPKLRLANWWSGRYEVDEHHRATPPSPGFAAAGFAAARPARPLTPPEQRRTAAEQLASARRRIEERRSRIARHRGRPNPAYGPTRLAGGRTRRYEPSGVNAGVVVAVVMLLVAVGGVVASLLYSGAHRQQTQYIIDRQEQAALAEAAKQAELARITAGNLDQLDDAFGDTTDGAPAGIAEVAPVPPVAGLVPAPDRPLDGLGLVLVCGFRPPLDKGLQQEIDAARADLTDAGVRLISNVVSGDTESLQSDVSTVAALIRMRNERTLNDENFDNELRDYVRNDRGVDAVWWVGRGDDKDTRQYLLVSATCTLIFDSANTRVDELARDFIAQAPAAATPPAEPAPPAPAEIPPSD
ncbi:MAG: hypothetical protein H6810_05610 [Phycisphaeraceae bacterium]|nr:MAG: hypothetical protein H6810_05610 [Phycisphaeraceae bacterium]